MKNIIILIISLLALFTTFATAGDDWRIDIFDRYQRMEIAWEKNDAELMQGFEPKLVEFYALWIPFSDALRKMRRYTFLKQLSEKPESIDWSDYSNWTSGTHSTDEEIKLSNKDPKYKRLRDDMLVVKKALKDAKLTWARNKVYEEHRDVIDRHDNKFSKAIQFLQEEINRNMANHGVVPDTAKDATPHNP